MSIFVDFANRIFYRRYKIISITRWCTGEFYIKLSNDKTYNVGRPLKEPRLHQTVKVYRNGKIQVRKLVKK